MGVTPLDFPSWDHQAGQPESEYEGNMGRAEKTTEGLSGKGEKSGSSAEAFLMRLATTDEGLENELGIDSLQFLSFRMECSMICSWPPYRH